jgi:hypothetical protein
MKATGIDFDGTEINDLRGIRIDAVLMCDTDKILCLVRDRIKMPIYYLVIAEVMKEWLATDRVNFLSMNSEEWVKSQITQLNVSAMAMIDEAAPGISRYLERQEPHKHMKLRKTKTGKSKPVSKPRPNRAGGCSKCKNK